MTARVTELVLTSEVPGAEPCPFCGSSDLDFGATSDDSECWVECENCGTQGPYATVGCGDEDEDEVDLEADAVALWNERVPAVRDRH